jgi:hypothetical protein
MADHPSEDTARDSQAVDPSALDPSAIDTAAEADHESLSSDTGRDGGPVDEQDMAAADGLTADPQVARDYGDMLERGAAQRGEGRVP